MGYSCVLIDYHDKKGLKGPLKDFFLIPIIIYIL